MEALEVVWGYKVLSTLSLAVIYSDHSALKSLLSARNPSGKLARLGMAPEIRYRLGCKNGSAEALSRATVEPVNIDNRRDVEMQEDILNNVSKALPKITQEQRQELYYCDVIRFTKEEILPKDKHLARKIVLSRPNDDLIDGVLLLLRTLTSIPRVVVPEK